MANTYTLISSTVLGSAQSTVTFSSIPQTYTDLVLTMSARHTGSSGADGIQFNTDTGTNYSNTYLYAAGSSPNSSRDSSAAPNSITPFWVPWGASATYLANTFSSTEMYIPNYTSTSNKSIRTFSIAENNSTTVNMVTATATLWRGTSAITQFIIKPNGTDTFVAGSSFYLYGIKNA